MNAEKITGTYADMDADPKDPVSWRFLPKRKNGKLGFADIVQELSCQGMAGNIYAQVFKVPEEFPSDETNIVELMEPEIACKILAQWCGYTLYDCKGKKIC